MKGESSNTKERILECAKEEFLEKGFKNASLRNICKMAGVTTGAVYGYFKDKDSIFMALVKDVMDGLKHLIDEIEGEESENDTLNFINDNNNRKYIVENHSKYVDYIYDNIDAMRLIITCSDGSSAENYLEDISKYLVDIDRKRLQQMGSKGIHIEEFVLHMLVKFYITSICELVEHNISREEALKNISTLSTFLFAGWAQLIKMRNNKE